jgi:hypothetical protein
MEIALINLHDEHQMFIDELRWYFCVLGNLPFIIVELLLLIFELLVRLLGENPLMVLWPLIFLLMMMDIYVHVQRDLRIWGQSREDEIFAKK